MADLGMTQEAASKEAKYLEGGEVPSPVFPGKATSVQTSCQRIVACTGSVPEPFSANYQYANPWLTKKDNKGKKDRPGPPQRPAVQMV